MFLWYGLVTFGLGALIAFPLLRFGSIGRSPNKLGFLLVPFLVPPLALFLNHSFPDCSIARWTTSLLQSCHGPLSYLFAATGVLAALRLAASVRLWIKANRLPAAFTRSTAYSKITREDLLSLCKNIGIAHPPPMNVTPEKAWRAYTVGCFSPIIILSEGMLAEADREELIMILAHELAHGVRRDPALLAALRVLTDLFWFHPGAHWLFQQAGEALEERADRLAIQLTGDPLAYGALLLKAWRHGAGGTALEPVPHLNQGSLERRVLCVLAEAPTARRTDCWLTAGFFLALFFAATRLCGF